MLWSWYKGFFDVRVFQILVLMAIKVFLGLSCIRTVLISKGSHQIYCHFLFLPFPEIIDDNLGRKSDSV